MVQLQQTQKVYRHTLVFEVLQATPHIVVVHTGTQNSSGEVDKHTFNLEERFRTFVVWKRQRDFRRIWKRVSRVISWKGKIHPNWRQKILLSGHVDGLADGVPDTAVDGVLLAGQDGGRQIQQSIN